MIRRIAGAYFEHYLISWFITSPFLGEEPIFKPPRAHPSTSHFAFTVGDVDHDELACLAFGVTCDLCVTGPFRLSCQTSPNNTSVGQFPAHSFANIPLALSGLHTST